MPCAYSYLQENFYNRFDGAVSITVILVSITVILKKIDTKVEGSNPSKIFFFFAFANMQEIFKINMFAEKACFDELCTCKTTSLNKMVKLV